MTDDDATMGDWAPFGRDRPGWSAGVRPEDQAWLSAYGGLDFPHSISNPVDALPPGYPAYTAVFHSLTSPGTDRRVQWITDPTPDPWEQVQHIADHGLDGWRWAADRGLAQPEAAVLADLLRLDSDPAPITVNYFFPPWDGTVDAAFLAELLRGEALEYTPTLWFPTSRSWVASSPYEAGWTYLASSDELAQQLRRHPRIETLACTHIEAD